MGIDAERTVVLTPRGPIETGVGPSWFDEGSDLATALDAVDDLIDEQAAKLGVPRASVVVGGLSQGGAAALALALRRNHRPSVGAAFCVSGFLLPPDQVDYDFARAAGVPVLVSHGTDDEVVAIQQGRSAARTLERNALRVRFREHAGVGHELDPAELADVRDWLAELGAGERSEQGRTAD
jgi:predicted esterase